MLLLTLAIFVVFEVVLRFNATLTSIYHMGSIITVSWMSDVDITKTRNIAYVLYGLKGVPRRHLPLADSTEASRLPGWSRC